MHQSRGHAMLTQSEFIMSKLVNSGSAVCIFPTCRELQWLVSTCWNRGCHHATFERPNEAVGFMEVALQLLQFCPELHDRKVWTTACSGIALAPVKGCQAAQCTSWTKPSFLHTTATIACSG